jgi:hypothetical protein
MVSPPFACRDHPPTVCMTCTLATVGVDLHIVQRPLYQAAIAAVKLSAKHGAWPHAHSATLATFASAARHDPSEPQERSTL